MKRIALMSLLTLMVVVPTSAQAPPKVDDRSAQLQRLATQVSNVGEFGRAVLQQVQLEAAKRLKEAKGVGPVEVQIRFTVREVLPKIPKPGEVDVCWETSSSMAQYVECTNPYKFSVPLPR